MVPYVKTGGLADVAGALPRALSMLGCECHSFLPAYRAVRNNGFGLARKLGEVFVPIRGNREKGVIWSLNDRRNHTIYFIEHDGYFNREGLYGTADGDYADNAERFAFFSRAVIEALRTFPIAPVDIIHLHDWQTALIPIYLKEKYSSESKLGAARTVLTIHNMAYQGLFDKQILPQLDLPWELFQIGKMEFWGRLNFLKGGLAYSDLLITVSPTYAREIQTPDCGAGLDGLLRDRSHDLKGILNGIDTTEWNPGTDPHLGANFSAANLNGKYMNKIELQKKLRLHESRDVMLIGFVGRLADQKGLDILFQALRGILELPVQMVVLGTGDRGYHDKLNQLKLQFPKQLCVELSFNNELAHRIYAGSDVFLMPSRYEPCGLGQLISFRYGTIPVVRKTGGLADTVRDASIDPAEGNGFVFSEYSRSALTDAVCRALAVFREKSRWTNLVHRAMALDFSWKRSAEAYIRLYEHALGMAVS
ncbi:MAG: glycogen synthase GlgA [Candidatus Omnitrophica bacterium]|nr:glycogen synthase GlgA [Candidatus Omnitrophota bacterium]